MAGAIQDKYFNYADYEDRDDYEPLDGAGYVMDKPAGLYPPVSKRRFTYADYKNWELKPGERYELIGGIAYAMAGPNDRHQAIAAALTAKFFVFLEGKPCKVRPAPYDVRLFYQVDEYDDTVVQPDLSVLCGSAKRGPEGGRGAPNFVAEIRSPSNSAIEMTRKFDLYRKAGVREYWVIDPYEKNLHAHCFEGGEVSTRVYGEKDLAPVEIFPGLEIALETVFAE
jgi:Uma2 family endonuclease